MNNNTCKHCSKDLDTNDKRRKYCNDECRRKQRRDEWRQQNPDWNKPIKKKCEWCEEDYEVARRYAHQARFCSDKCNGTWWSREVYGHRPLEEWEEKIERLKQERKIRLELERKKRLVDKKCEWCGSKFETAQKQQVTCSSDCSRKRKRRMEHLKKDERLNETNIVDRDITLERLFSRDKGSCYICNKPCHYDDKTITKEGYFVAGETYPSIDHVYPLARGGKHAWDNVRLAHHRCNGEKSDDLPGCIKPLPKDIAYSVARRISPRSKVTIQLTTEGKEINRFNSTREAERETGVKAKGIQNCARGELKTYKGYIWRYA